MRSFIVAAAFKFIVIFTLSFNVYARAGEWESSGAPQPPHTPQGSLNFQCQIKLARQIDNKYEIFILDHEVNTKDFSDGQAVLITNKTDRWMKLIDQKAIPLKAKDAKLGLDSVRMRLSFLWDYPSQTEKQVLTAYLDLLHGKTKISSSQQNTISWSFEENRTTVNLSVVSQKQNPQYVALRLDVSCTHQP